MECPINFLESQFFKNPPTVLVYLFWSKSLKCPHLPTYLNRLLEESEIEIKDTKLFTASTWMISVSLYLLYYAKNVKE